MVPFNIPERVGQVAQGIKIPPGDHFLLLFPIGGEKLVDKSWFHLGIVQEKEVLVAPDIVDGPDDKVVIPTGQGLLGGRGILVGLTQLDPPVKPASPSLGNLLHGFPGLFHPRAVTVRKILALAVVREGVGPQSQLLGPLAHFPNRVRSVRGAI